MRETLYGADGELEARFKTNQNFEKLFRGTGLNSGASMVETPTTGGEITPDDGVAKLFLTPEATLATLEVNFPVDPKDGDTFQIFTTQILTALTLTSDEAIAGEVTTMPANSCVKYEYNAVAETWFRVAESGFVPEE